MDEVVTKTPKQQDLLDGVKIIIEVVRYGDDMQKQTLHFKNVTDLPVTKWDGYRLVSIRILCYLTSIKDANHLIGFLKYHQYCLGVGTDIKDIIY